MSKIIILATSRGAAFATLKDGTPEVIRIGLEDRRVTAVIAREGVIIAGTRNGLFRSSDLGENWEPINAGLETPHIRWLAFHPDIPDREFAGTEPAGIYVSDDGGHHWQESENVRQLRDKLGWWLPYSPESGCVRGFAFHGDRGYAAVEVGGVLRSNDGGRSWDLAPGSSGRAVFETPAPGHIHADVHSIGVHPSSPDLVFAATNAGLYRSRDGGEEWERINEDGYTRAFWVSDDDPDHILTAPARSVGRGGTVLETRDGGASWAERTDGLETPWPETMVERFASLDAETLAAVLDDGRLFLLDWPSGHWRRALEEVSRVNAVAVMKDRPTSSP